MYCVFASNLWCFSSLFCVLCYSWEVILLSSVIFFLQYLCCFIICIFIICFLRLKSVILKSLIFMHFYKITHLTDMLEMQVLKMFCIFCSLSMTSTTWTMSWAPRPLSGSPTHASPCVWSVRQSSLSHGGDITVEHVEGYETLTLLFKPKKINGWYLQNNNKTANFSLRFLHLLNL